MIKLKHYIARWEYFDSSRHFGGYPQSFFHLCERYLKKEEAEKRVSEELEKFKKCEVSDVEWFIKSYLNNIEKYFFVEECDEIY